MSERVRRIDPELIASRVATQIDEILDQKLLNDEEYQKLDPAWQMATRELITDSAIIQELARRSGVSTNEALIILAEKTAGTNRKSERLIAITEGIARTGVMFGESVKRKIEEKIGDRTPR